MTDKNQQCDLCGLPVPPKGYCVETAARTLAFCCEGCKGIWLMLHGESEPSPAQEAKKP